MRKADPALHAQRREQILEAAIRCFVRTGFHKTTTAEIAAEAGLSTGNLFHYLPNKNALISAIVSADAEQTRATFEKLWQSPDILSALLEVTQEVLTSWATPEYLVIGAEVIAEATRNPEIAALYKSNNRETRDGLTRLLRAGIARGQIDATIDAEAAATWLIALVDGAITQAALGPDFDVERHGATLRRLIKGFLAPQPAREGVRA